MRNYMLLIEKYTRDNTYLLQYLRDGKFDPYSYWNEIRVWLDEHPQYLKLFGKAAGKRLPNADAIDEEEPDIFFKLPENIQQEAAEWVIEWLVRHDPAEAPTYTHAGLSDKQLLPRTTWLVHFTDDPDGVVETGFTIGVHDMTKLGLTTYMKNDSFYKQHGGYNFAFLANGRDARWAAKQHKYGKDAVMFQNSGVLTHHYADEETQVIFKGEDVDPRTIVMLRNYDGDWRVQPRRETRRYGGGLFSGDFEQCVNWVQQNFAQYRRYLTGY